MAKLWGYCPCQVVSSLLAEKVPSKRELSSAGGGQPYAFRDRKRRRDQEIYSFLSVYYFAKKIDEITMVLEPIAL